MIACEVMYSPMKIHMISHVKIHMFQIHMLTFTSFHISKSNDFACENSQVSKSHVNFTRVNSCGILVRVYRLHVTNSAHDNDDECLYSY